MLTKKLKDAGRRTEGDGPEGEIRSGAPRSSSALEPYPGLLLGEKYRLEALIASGGMGSVWAARHVELDSPVAIKLMLSIADASPRAKARFKREAKAAARLRSRHVVAILDYGLEHETPYIVMERLYGEDLSTRIEREGLMPIHQVAKLLDAIAVALGLAHAANIVHRDLKSENIFLARYPGEAEEVVKVLDFGLSKELRPASEHDLTSTGQVMGTPHYMSPEQAINSKDVDPRSDLWSLGVILFNLLTGRLPFNGTTYLAVLNNVVQGPIPAPSAVAPYLGAAVDRFFARALARDLGARFQSIQEMTRAFHLLVPASPPNLTPEPSSTTEVEISTSDFLAIDAPQVSAWVHGEPSPQSAPTVVERGIDRKGKPHKR